MALRFLTNTHDPKDPNAKRYVARLFDQTPEDAWRCHQDWLRGKVIGEPKGTDFYTPEELKGMGMVGVYVEEPEGDESTQR